jgi:hypothetical protein
LLISLSGFFLPLQANSQSISATIHFDFYGDSIELPANQNFSVPYSVPITEASIQQFYNLISQSDYSSVINKLVSYKKLYNLDDWLYFQLIRRTAQTLSPKASNYERYTLYKWFMLAKSGYDTRLKIANGKMLLYVQSDEEIFEIPYYERNGKQYVCLNYHDYGSNINFEKEQFREVNISIPEARGAFSYKVTKLPDFEPKDYIEKDLHFTYFNNDYSFKIKMNPQVNTIFSNYPVVDYESCFNIPLSKETYASLIPVLKKNLKGMNTKNGIDYLMRFTRYAFLFEADADQFGKEKRMTPEQTLVYAKSDCEDRASLFYFLVKEIYNLPMIVLVYPLHVTIAIKFDKPIGKPIIYHGSKYTVCEPTPQSVDLAMGKLPYGLKKEHFQVAFEYNPSKH